MGALPKKRQTNSRQGHRRQHHKIKIPQLKICPQCHQARLSHHACPNCGTYRGRQVLPVRERRPAAESSGYNLASVESAEGGGMA